MSKPVTYKHHTDALGKEILRVRQEVVELKRLFAEKSGEVRGLQRASELRPPSHLCRTEANWKGED